MGPVILSLAQARLNARDQTTYLLWLTERAARDFNVDGWQELKPHRNGAVLFVHREREQAIARACGVNGAPE